MSRPDGTALGVSPNFLGNINYERELRPLLVFGQQIAFFGTRKAALRAETQLIEIDEFGSGFNPALDFVFGFELAGFGCDQSEHDLLSLGNQPLRLEATGAVGIVFHYINVDIGLVEQGIGNCVVSAGALKG